MCNRQPDKRDRKTLLDAIKQQPTISTTIKNTIEVLFRLRVPAQLPVEHVLQIE